MSINEAVKELVKVYNLEKDGDPSALGYEEQLVSPSFVKILTFNCLVMDAVQRCYNPETDCKGCRSAELFRNFRMKCRAFDRGLLEILDSIRTDYIRMLDSMATGSPTLKEAIERACVVTAASALLSASCFARQLLYGASADEQVEEARVFDKWLAEHGFDVPRRVIDMETGREEGKDA